MNTYFRILSFAKPFGRFAPKYILFVVLSIVFSLTTFSLLSPLLNTIFDTDAAEKLTVVTQKPVFDFTLDYAEKLFKYYFNQVIRQEGKAGALGYVCVIIVVANFFANIFRYLAGRTMGKVRATTVRNIRKALFERITCLHIGFFSNERKGDIMSRVTNDIQEVEGTIISSLKVIFKEPATIIGYFIFLFTISVELTLFTVVILPISGGVIAGIAKRLKKKAAQSQKNLGEMVGTIDETIGGVRVINAFNALPYIISKFNRKNDKYARINISMSNRFELAGPISEFLGIIAVALVLYYGGSLVLEGTSSLNGGQFIAYIALFSQILQPAKAISNASSGIQRGLASADRILQLLDTETEISDKENAKDLPSFNHSVEFKNVWFAYEKENILKGINLTINKGEMVALVGQSGGGKSTMADLIPRFYDPIKGDITIDGISLKDLKLESLRKHMGIVTQESILFNDTVFNNIAFGIENASEEEVIKAAKIANAHEFISKLPGGYNEIIGDRGVKLSGGQRQRLSIARAVFKNPPILILDEATSALDSESEKLVQEALTNLMKNRTSIVIAHRLSTIQHADKIVVVNKGEIAECGTHEELVNKEGIYSKLTRMQLL
ncbi:MAG TPA: ABC transporter ATP-binding protein [Cytophagales bacterium]|nr:ABC transporter ATP-binding protein [Cytophagales bacterium]